MFRATIAAVALASALTASAPAFAADLGPTTLLSAVAGSTMSSGDDCQIALGSPNDHEAITPDGRDTIDGGLGRDTIRGGAGDDTIKVRGGKGDVDTIDCGAGKHDVATVDKADKVRNCETVRRK